MSLDARSTTVACASKEKLPDRITANMRGAERYCKVGRRLARKWSLSEAFMAFSKATQLAPEYADGHLHLGIVAREMGRYQDALHALRKAIDIDPSAPAPYFHLGWTFEELGDHPAAIRAFADAIHIHPAFAEAHLHYAVVLGQMGLAEEAIRRFRATLEFAPRDARALWGMHLTLPKIYENEAQLLFHRARWKDGIAMVRKRARELGSKRALDLLGWQTNFRLHYQGDDLTEVQRRYGALITELAGRAFGDSGRRVEMRRKRRKGRLHVGFASGHFRNHTVMKLFGGWILLLDRDQFDVHLIDVGVVHDAVTRQVASDCLHHKLGQMSSAQIVEYVGALHLDVIVYLDVGMDAKVQVLGALRLAPVQCCTWGHPVTTGLEAMDYFLSSRMMEPSNGERHYSEVLVRLPNLSIAYAPPTSEGFDPDAQVETHEAPVFACTQSLFKLLPQYDWIYPSIAAGIPGARFTFIQDTSESCTSMFCDRLLHAFAAAGMDARARVQVLPRQTLKEFLQLNQSCTALLDSIEWSGGNTSLEALHCNTPIVCCPGRMMRARHTAAILERAGVPELIARNLNEYVRLAVRLGSDMGWRRRLKERICLQKGRVFNDVEPVRALEAFLLSVCGSSR